MKSRHLIFVIVTVLVMSCLTIAGTGEQDALYEQYQTFSRIVATIQAYYVEEVDTDKLFYGAYTGMLQTLDPHSSFLPPEEKVDLQVETEGEFGGLGIEISTDKNGILTVITPLEDTPAFQAGVLAGDRIIRIEGKTTKGMSLRDAVNQLRGPKGTPVTITVFHEDGRIEDIKVVRDIIKIQSVKGAHFADEKHKVGYVRLTQFQKRSAEDLDKAVGDLLDKGMKALVIDLRYNPGGLLNTAVEIADRFISDGIIVSTKGRRINEQVFRATVENTYTDFPIAVLIGARSASASEILAGAIQDHRRGIIIGMRSYGKGSVQSVITLQDRKSGLRLTTAYYYTPAGRLIHHNQNNPDQKTWGIDPDIEVKVTLQDEVDLWKHWRDEQAKRSRELNGAKNGEEPKEMETLPETQEQIEEEFGPLNTPLEDQGAEAEKPREFRDHTLEAAVNALQGMMLSRERAAVEAEATAK